MNAPLWKSEDFLIAAPGGPSSRHGFVYRGLGVHKIIGASPRGRRPPLWSVTHLGSGHRVGNIHAHIVRAFDIATMVAECVEWDWNGLDGYRNIEPDLAQKLRDFVNQFGKEFALTSGSGYDKESALEIAMARA